MKRFLYSSKRGISLAYVIVAAMALLILSGTLVAAASRNEDLTLNSVDGRQAYLTAKSAVEYAKGVISAEAQAGSVDSFSVVPGSGSNPFQIKTPAAVPDGKTVYAECVNNDGNVKVSAKVRFRNSEHYRTFGCEMQVSNDSSPVNNKYFISGTKFGSNAVLNSGDTLPSTTIDFPVLFKMAVKVESSVNFSAQEIFFMNSNSLTLTPQNDQTNTSLTGELIYFDGNIKSLNSNSNACINLNSAHGSGIVWFHHTTISTPNGSISMDGAYYFSNNTNLLNLSTIQGLEKASDKDIDKYEEEVSYLQENVSNIFSGEEIGWTGEGNLQTGDSGSGKDVFLYVTSVDRLSNQMGNYEANFIFFLAGNNSLSFQNGASVSMETSEVWLSGSNNGKYDKLTLSQQNSSGNNVNKFILSSPDGKGNVTILIPCSLTVRKAGGTSYTVDSTKNQDYDVDDPSTYTYTFTGDDLFTASQDDFLKSSGPGNSGSGGSSTISSVRYTDS